MTNPLPSLASFPLPNLAQLPALSDLSRASGSWLATIGVGLAVGLPFSSTADPIEQRPMPRSFRWVEPSSDHPPAWLGENVYYKKGYGLEYRLHETKVGETPIEVGVQGPIVRKKKSVGLTLEVRF